MRIVNIVLVAVCLSACISVVNGAEKNMAFADDPVVSHRGAWKKNALPENSIASLKHAIEIQCAGSEFDVRMTADDSLIINHDPNYNKLPIEKTNYADLIAFKLSNEEKLPTFREYLLAGKENNTTTRLVCEIKPSEISKERGIIIASKVLQLVKELNIQQRLVYISFDYDILKKLIELEPTVTTQYLGSDKSPEQLKADGISGADYHFSAFKAHPEWIESAKKNHIALNAWTVNDVADMDWLLANNFDFITTNEPELLFERMKLSPVYKGMKLFWNDEFNYKGLPDSSKWSYNVGGNGWGNNEAQYYTEKDTLNAQAGNGTLKIIARKQTKGNKKYTSARLVTSNKAEFKYGKIEVRAKLPRGLGTWPAIWMLGKNMHEVGWPACGEIDIMEHVGYQNDSIFGTVHTKAYNHTIGTQKVKSIFILNPYDQFHVYSIDWAPEQIDFSMDGIVYNHIVNEHLSTKEWPLDQPFFLILNLAIGGGWGGKMGIDDSIFPAVFEVDYVRVFKSKDNIK
ncbi:MAG: family 16 glycosylhydrolase [Bacteroidota bacterium]|nr:family 16 glycosylhydrolase [Bacteroidota bacterium]